MAYEAAEQADRVQARQARVHTERLANAIVRAIQGYERGVEGIRGAILMAGTDAFSPDKLSIYLRTLDLGSDVPGTSDFGFLVRQPSAAPNPERGADSKGLMADARVREAADRATRSMQPTLAAPIVDGSGLTASLVLLVPVYGSAAHVDSASSGATRQAALLGWAYVTLDAAKLIRPLHVDQLFFVLQIRDITDDPMAAPFHASGAFDMRTGREAPSFDTVSLYGRVWRVATQPTPLYFAKFHLAPTATGGLVGSVVSVLLGSFVVVVLSLRARRLDLQLRAREQFRLAMDAAPTGIIVLNATGRITFINRHVEKLFGYERSELVGRPVEILVPEPLRIAWSRWWKVFRRRGMTRDLDQRREFYGRHRYGREVPIEIGVSPLDTADGSVVLCSITDITERRAAAEQLQALNARLEAQVTQRSGELRSVQRGLATILDALPSMIGYWDSDLVNRMTNRAYRDLLASYAATRDGLPAHDLDPLIAVRPLEVAAALRGDSVSFEHSLEERSEVFARHLLVHLIPDMLDGSVLGFHVLAHDVTELNRSALKLAAVIRENEGLLKTLNQHALVSVADRKGQIIDVNAAFCAISGYSRYELLGQDHRIVSSSTHPPEFWNDMWRQVGQGKPWRAEVCNRAKNGSLYWVDSIITPFFGEDGRIVKYISIRFDITAHKDAQRRLIESERFLQRVEKVSGVGGFIIDFASGVERWTRQSEAIFEVEDGRPRSGELIDSLLIPEVRERLRSTSRSACETGEGYDIEIPIITAAGHSIWIRAVGEIEHADGVPVRVFGAIEDITTRRAMEDQLRNATAAAERASKAKSEFLANMSHEIRTPLNAVIGLGYLFEQTSLSEDQHQLLNKIQFAGRALLTVVNNVLDLSKIEAGEVSLEDEAFDLTALAREVCQMLAPEARLKGIELVSHIAPTLPRQVRGDSVRLRQVLTNLLNNGIKFTASGSVQLELDSVASERDAPRLRCVVRDTGIGIDPTALKLLFSPFTQADASTTRRFGGTGLGLSIARRLVNLMGGQIGVDSAVGVGSTFWFELPLCSAAEGSGASRESVPESLDPEEPHIQWLAGVRVLVVDDSEINLEVARRILEQQGALVACCADGTAAVEHVRSHYQAIDVVLMDIQMPFLDGNEATHSIRRDLGLLELPVIALTAGALVGERQRSIEAGVNDFISKPFDPLALIQTVRRLVEHARGQPIPKVVLGTSRRVGKVGGTPMSSIDPTVVQQMFGDDLTLFRSLLTRLLRDYTDLVDAPLERLDALAVHPSLGARTHKLKGSAGMIGASRVMRLAGAVETALQAHRDPETIEGLLRDLGTALSTLREEAGRFFDAHPPRVPSANSTPLSEADRRSEVGELQALLDRQDLAAIDLFQTLAGDLGAALSVDDFDRLRTAVENLDFQSGSDILRRSGVTSGAASV